MILIVLQDKVAGTWSNPVCVANEASAKRDFVSACADPKTVVGQHPADYWLYAIADWVPSLDESKLPVFRAYDAPKLIMQGVKPDEQ